MTMGLLAEYVLPVKMQVSFPQKCVCVCANYLKLRFASVIWFEAVFFSLSSKLDNYLTLQTHKVVCENSRFHITGESPSFCFLFMFSWISALFFFFLLVDGFPLSVF